MTSRRPTVLMIHDYPPYTGGGLALGVRELVDVLRPDLSCRIVSSRAHDHFADDRVRLASGTPEGEPACALAGPIRTLRWIRDADAVVIHWTFSFRLLSTLFLVVAPWLRRPTVLVVHTSPDHCDYNRIRRLPLTLRRMLLAAASTGARGCTTCVALSNGHAEALSEAGFPPAHILPLPVSPPPVTPSRDGQTDTLGTVLVLGELSALKGADAIPALLRVLAPSFSVHVVGRGPLAGRIRASTEALSPALRSRVTLADRLDPGAVGALYERADYLLVLSRSESQSRVTLEAMHAGVLVLARRAGGIPDLVEDGVTGFFIDPDDPGAVRDALLALADDAATAERVRRAARARAVRICSAGSLGWRSLLLEMLAPGAGRGPTAVPVAREGSAEGRDALLTIGSTARRSRR